MENTGHVVAIFGGAVSGSEAAFQLAQRGIQVVVFEQNTLPFGKIEDGLPKWHGKLRDKEENKINEKMNHPLVTYVPNTKLGSDIDFSAITNWGFSAIILASGAWRDRPLPIEGIDEYINKGLYYQNPFIYWYNHNHDPDSDSRTYDTPDNTIVVGGGLASIDVCKALMMENAEKALSAKGIYTNMLELDKGIDRVLEKHGLTLGDLGIKGCTLYYRRRNIDMPLSPMAADTPELLEKAQNVRAKVLDNAMRKFFFKFEGNSAPIDMIVEQDKLVGIKFQRTEIVDGKVKMLKNSEFEVRGPLVISSIGSLPEPIAGIPMEWETFKVGNQNLCSIEGFENVFAVGNAVTGKGNIKDSSKHSLSISNKIMDDYIGWSDEDFENFHRAKEANVGASMAELAAILGKTNFLTPEKIEDLYNKIADRQMTVSYDGNYNAWVEKHLPARLETLVAGH